jgi:hypothetical protein
MSVDNKFIERISGDWTLKTTTADGLITLDTGLPGTTLITGDLSVIGNVSFTGNASTVSNAIASGTTSIAIPAASGNAVVTIGGSSVGNFYSGGFSTVGNITSDYVLGNGVFLTGLSATYSNANVANYLPTYTGNLVSMQGAIITTANISGNYFIGNGSLLTGLYSNANVADYLASYTGNISAGNISSSGNITGNYFVGNGSLLTGVVATGIGVLASLSVTGNINTGNLLTGGVISSTGNATAGNLLTGGVVSATGNISGNNIITTGNISGANVISGNTFSASGDITGGNILTGGTVSATGNATAGNLLTSGVVSSTGDITTGGNIFGSGNLSITGRIQGANVKIGTDAGLIGQSYNGIAIGLNAGSSNQGNNSVAIGSGAGDTNQSDNSIILNASATSLNSTEPGLYINPVRNNTTNISNVVTYNVTTKELTYTDTLSLAGNIQFANASATGNVTIDGDLTVSGNAYLSGNIVGDRIQNGTTIIDIQTPNGNANVTVNGVGNIAVFSTQGLSVGGIVSATGNVSGNYILGNGALLSGIITSVSNINNGNSNVEIASSGSNITVSVGGTSNVAVFATTGEYVTGEVSATGNVSGNYFFGNGSQLTGVIASGGQGNTITLGTPTDGSLTQNVAYPGWTTATYVTDGLDDLNQVSLNIANGTYVGNAYVTANTTSGPSPLSVAFTGHYIGTPNSYLWDFGDGTTSTSANPTHTYSNVLGGQFTVVYTAYNTNGTYNGNAALGAKGSTSTSTNTDYITLFTPLPIPSFTTSPTSLDTGSSVTVTNTSLYATSYSINYGDGNIVNPGNSFVTNSHTYINSANTDALRSITLTGTNQTAGNAPPYSVTSAATNVKIFTEQSPVVTANVVNTINYLVTSGGVVSFRNDTPGSPGNTASFGVQQLYNYQWGDGTANSNINIQTGLAGNPSAANITHTFSLTSVQQNAATSISRVANLWLYTGYSTSPFKSSNVTITIEPEVRANFVGTSNTQTDATGFTSNAQVGYLYTDYNGLDRSLFNFRNDTSPNVAFTGNVFNWTWGDTTSNTGLLTFGNITHSYQSAIGSPTTGAKTVTLQANGTPGTTSQSNTQTKTGYITILANPTAPTNLSGFANLAIANASQFVNAPLLAAGANDNTGGNIVANGISVTRFATTTPIVTGANIINANTATTGTLTAFVNNTAAGNVTFTTGGNTVGTVGALIVSADRDLHVANAAVPTGFYKVFNANLSCALSSLGTGYNNYKMVHSVSGNTNYVGFVKDNLNSVPTLSTGSVLMVEATAGTYRYISGIPYYNTGSPTVTIANLVVANLSGQTFTSTNPFILDSGTVYEGSGSVVSASQTKSLATINNSGNSFLTGANLNANVGVASNYTFGNLTANLGGSNNSVSTLQANLLNVIGTSTTVQLPTRIQMYAGANSGVNEQSITCTPTANTQAAIRIVMSTAGNAPVFANNINYYTSNAWSGAQTIANTPEAVVRYGVLQQYAVDLSTGYLPVGPNLSISGNRTSTQYFTFAFARPSLANFDIRLTTTTGVAGVWLAAPGTTIDSDGFSSPTPGFPGPTSTINGWLEGFTQYAGSGVPGAATGTGGNGSNGCALTGADVIPLNTAIANVGYTMTLGSQNAANSTGTNILIRIALASGQSITALSIGVAA